MNACPPLSAWEELSRESCEPRTAEELRAHLASCGACRTVHGNMIANDRLLGAVKAALGSKSFAGSAAFVPVGLRIGRFEVTGFLGAGGMATVYRATQDHPRRTVALKVMKQGFASHAAVRRFENEAELLGRLQHPGIAQIFEAGVAEVGGQPLPYFAMELIEGEKLTDYAASRKSSTRDRLELMTRIGAAIHNAHQKGIIHRDLKPSNILVDAQGNPKILDFGIARATDIDVQATTLRTDIGQLVGTIPYMSPEQTSGDPAQIDFRSDVYALGIICYELLAGHLPYSLKGRTVPEAVRVIQEEDPARLSSVDRGYRGDIETITAKALEKDKTRRYPSALALVEDLQRYLNDEPISARPASAAYQLAKFARRNRVLVGGVVAVFLGLLFALLGTGYGLFRATAARNLAVESERRAQAKQAEAEAVVDLLEEMLGSANPHRVKGADYTVRELLDAFSRGLSEQLKDQPEVEATLRATIGNAYRGLGIREQTEHHLKAALDLRLKVRGPENEEVAQSLFDYGWYLHDNADYPVALRMFRESLAMRRRLLGPEHRDVAASLDGVADILRHQGNYAEAEPLAREALAMRRKLLGLDHQDVAQSFHTLGMLLRDKGDFAEAEVNMREALTIRRKIYSGEHPDIAYSLHELAKLLNSKADYEAAAPVFQEALSMSRKTLGENHHEVGVISTHFGALLRDKGDYPRAEGMLRRGIDMGRAVHGDVHVCVAWQEHQLGALLRLIGEHQAAESLLRRVLDVYLKLEGDESLDTDLVRVTLAIVLIDQGSFEEARRLAAEALPHHRARHGEQHRHVAEASRVLGLAMLLGGNAADAEPHLQDSVRVLRELPYTERWRVARAESALGACLAGLTRLEEAEALLLQSHQTLYAEKGPGFIETHEALERIVGLYEVWRKPQEADEWKSRLWSAQARKPERGLPDEDR